MKEPSSTLVSLCVAFSLFNYQINGGTSYETKQANLQIKFLQLWSLNYNDGDDNDNATKQFNRLNKQKIIALHVRFTFWYISSPSSAKQQREMTKF